MKTILYLLATTACKASCYQPRATAWDIDKGQHALQGQKPFEY